MGFNRFYFILVIRIVLIVITGILLSFFISQIDKIMTSIISFILIIIQTVGLIKYINKTNTDLASFLLRIHSKDTAVNYENNPLLKNFKGLNISFEQINRELQQIRIENEQKTHYLDAIVNHVKVGIIAFDEDGNIELFNPEASRILQCENFKFMNTLEERLPDFHHAITNTSNEKNKIIKLNLSTEIINLTIKKTIIKVGMKTIHVISFQNIQRELDHNELESWQKLIQVLNHELMNSLTPITTLSKTTKRYIHKDGILKKASELSDEIVKDIAINTEIIEERGKGLIDFIRVYKDISKNPTLNLSTFNVAQSIQKVQKFYQQQFNDQQIRFEQEIPNNLELKADEALIEQILINLIKNSLEALKENINAQIKIQGFLSKDGDIVIRIEDNGVGIPESEIDKIFTPFYSTKENGSGIGLSLSKQIMHLHKGRIYVSSKKDEETTFTLEF